MRFVLNESIPLEESLTCEFKEVIGNPVQAVTKVVDEYVVAFLNESGGSIFWGIRDKDRVVTGVPLPGNTKDEIRQVIGQKLSAIAPGVPGDMISVPFHPLYDGSNAIVPALSVLEVRVAKPSQRKLYLTGGGAAYRRTQGGTKKLGGAELFLALLDHAELQKPSADRTTAGSMFPRLQRRAETVRSLVEGRRVLWVDDHPEWNLYERMALSELGVYVDVAHSTDEALVFAGRTCPDLVISDMVRGSESSAGMELVARLRAKGLDMPVAFYVGQVDTRRGVPPGAVGIVDRPDEILHLALDVLER